MGVMFTNNAFDYLAFAMTSSDTNLILKGTGANFPKPAAAGDWFPLVVQNAGGAREIMRATANNSNGTLVVVRAQEGTQAQSWAIGDRVELRFTAEAIAAVKADAIAASKPTKGDTMFWWGDATKLATLKPGWQLADGTNGTPDMRGRFPVAASSGDFAAGKTGGSTSVKLTVAQLPAHTHDTNEDPHSHQVNEQPHAHGVNDPQHDHDVPNATGEGSSAWNVPSDNGGWSTHKGVTLKTTKSATNISINTAKTNLSINGAKTGITIKSTGNGDAIDIRPPFIALHFLIYVG